MYFCDLRLEHVRIMRICIVIVSSQLPVKNNQTQPEKNVLISIGQNLNLEKIVVQCPFTIQALKIPSVCCFGPCRHFGLELQPRFSLQLS
jgi:hypothetical protein